VADVCSTTADGIDELVRDGAIRTPAIAMPAKVTAVIAGDPESKGAVEALVRYAKSDLVVPADDFAGDLAAANTAAQVVDKLSTVRIGSARYSVPHLLRAAGRSSTQQWPGVGSSTMR
jgi:hypothetical protein